MVLPLIAIPLMPYLHQKSENNIAAGPIPRWRDTNFLHWPTDLSPKRLVIKTCLCTAISREQHHRIYIRLQDVARSIIYNFILKLFINNINMLVFRASTRLSCHYIWIITRFECNKRVVSLALINLYNVVYKFAYY